MYNCPSNKKHNSKGSRGPICHYCKKPGHVLANCRFKKNKSQSTGQANALVGVVSVFNDSEAVLRLKKVSQMLV